MGGTCGLLSMEGIGFSWLAMGERTADCVSVWLTEVGGARSTLAMNGF